MITKHHVLVQTRDAMTHREKSFSQVDFKDGKSAKCATDRAAEH